LHHVLLFANIGTFHHVSQQHLDRYIDEFAFRYNRRDISDTDRTVSALKKVVKNGWNIRKLKKI